MTTTGSRRRGAGRPPSTTFEAVLDAVEQLGVARFTVADLAGRLGIREATLYNYVSGRDDAYRAASSRILSRLDTSAPDAKTWTEYVETICLRGFELVRAHPGIEPYIHSGPYLPDTARVFTTLLDEVRSRLPGISEDTAYAVTAPPFLITVWMANEDDVADLARWIRLGMIEGMATRLERGEEVPQIDWRRLMPIVPLEIERRR